MATKDTTRKAAQEAAVKEKSNPTSATEAAGEVSNKQEQQSDHLQNLQQQASTALNALWVELRRQGYMAYNTILLLGIAFEVKKDEDNDFYFVPNNLTQNSIYRKNREEERTEDEVTDEVTQGLNLPTIAHKRNITGNRGRSVEAGRNDNTPFRG